MEFLSVMNKCVVLDNLWRIHCVGAASQHANFMALLCCVFRAGSLYDANFVTQMHKHSKKLSLSERAQTLTECMQVDAECRRRKTQPVETQNQGTVETLYKGHPRWWPLERGGLSLRVK